MGYGATEACRILAIALAASAVGLAFPTSAQASETNRLELQSRLAELGYLPANSGAGIGAERTRNAILAFQSWEGLPRTGPHGCLRVPLTDAPTVYGFARLGVPVRVVS